MTYYVLWTQDTGGVPHCVFPFIWISDLAIALVGFLTELSKTNRLGTELFIFIVHYRQKIIGPGPTDMIS